MNITKWQGKCRFLCTLTVLGLLSACTDFTLIRAARDHDLRYSRVTTDLFQLVVVTREAEYNHTRGAARIYLEGDGIPWRNDEPSTNPTGQKRLSFQLFLQDKFATAYLARPCYEQETMPPNCITELWTSGRYSETVVTKLIRAIEQIAPEGDIELVGYSGGGTLAALIAHRLTRVSRVLT